MVDKEECPYCQAHEILEKTYWVTGDECKSALHPEKEETAFERKERLSSQCKSALHSENEYMGKDFELHRIWKCEACSCLLLDKHVECSTGDWQCKKCNNPVKMVYHELIEKK